MSKVPAPEIPIVKSSVEDKASYVEAMGSTDPDKSAASEQGLDSSIAVLPVPEDGPVVTRRELWSYYRMYYPLST